MKDKKQKSTMCCFLQLEVLSEQSALYRRGSCLNIRYTLCNVRDTLCTLVYAEFILRFSPLCDEFEMAGRHRRRRLPRTGRTNLKWWGPLAHPSYHEGRVWSTALDGITGRRPETEQSLTSHSDSDIIRVIELAGN